MLIKNKLKKVISIGVISTTIFVSAFAVLGIYSSSLKTNYNFVVDNSSKEHVGSSKSAYLDSQISELETPSSYYSIDANQYYNSLNLSTLISNYSDELRSENVSNVVQTIKSSNQDFSTSNFYKDILYFFKNIYKKLNGKVSLIINKNEFSISGSSVSFDYIVEMVNTSNTNISFSIENNVFYIPFGKSKNLEIKTSNQGFYFGISKNYNNYYLNWNTDVTLTFDDKEYLLENFSFTKNDYSIAIQTYVKGISSSSNYQKISTTDSYFKNLTTDNLKTNIDSYLSSNLELSLNMLSYLTPIVSSINSNTTIYNLLSSQKDNLSKIILKLLGIEESNDNYDSYKNLFMDLLSSDDSLLTIVGNNGKSLANLIALLINDSSINSDVIYTYIKGINGNLSDKELEEQKSTIKGLISFFVTSMGTSSNIDLNFVNDLINMVFNKSTTTLSLISYIFNDKSDDLINMLTTNESTKLTYQMYFKLIALLVNDPSQLVLNELLSNDGKQLLSDIITSMMGSNTVQGDSSNSLILSLVQQIVSPSNGNLNSKNLSSLLSKLVVPLLSFLSNNDNYTLTKTFNSISYNQTKKTVSYNYSIQFEFKNNFSFNINSVLNVLPDTLKMGSTSIPTSMLEYMLKQNNTALQMTIGAGDKIIFTFNGDNEQINLSPTLNNGAYVANFNIMYHLVMRLDMPTLFNSITSFYKTGTWHSINNSIVKVLKDFLKYFLIRDYDFYGMISILDKNTTISNYDSNIYYKNNYFSWKQPESSFFSDLKNNITSEESNSYSLKLNNYNVLEQSKPIYETVTGSKPVINDSYLSTIETNIMDYNSDVAPIVKITPEVNSNMSVNFIGVNLSDIQITLVKVQVWFPYSVINTTDPNNLTFSNYFNVEINLN